MVLGIAVAIFKPFLFVWVTLNLIDDLALVIRLGRLAASVVPFPGKRSEPNEMCGLCDDVVEGLMAGAEGISVIPCRATCLGIPNCIRMCERVQEVSQTSTEFPCVAAGFCDPMDTGYIDVDSADSIDCTGGAFFSCHPRQYCRRKREGFKLKCELRPGIGRWNGMRHMAAHHTVSLVEGLKNQLHCGEEGAGEYCIEKPTGTGLIAEWVGHFISLVVGGYNTIIAIETPGGADDRQWLTFWLILSIFLFVERFFARILLSNLTLYYECKLAALVWLIWRQGAETCYRKLRQILESCTRSLITSDAAAAEKWIEIFKKTGGDVVERQLEAQATASKKVQRDSKWSPNHFWEYDDDFENETTTSSTTMDATQQLFVLSKFLLSAEGSKQLEQSTNISEQKKSLLIERAAQVVSFQPRFLRIKLLGSIDGLKGELPAMDSNGLADGYVSCKLVPSLGKPYPRKGIKSSTAYHTLSPQWNEEIEIPLRGGHLDADGFFYIDEVLESTQLRLKVMDADVGQWCYVLYLFRGLLWVGVILAMAAYVEGASDNLTKTQEHVIVGGTAAVLLGYLVSYVMAVMRRSDDEIVGVCKVPLGILMDQKEHTLLLTLHPDNKSTQEETVETQKTNSVGGYGVIRVKLMLSEN